jgi:hypothetical protein
MGDRSAKGADDDGDMLLLDQALGCGDADVGLAGVVGVVGFDRAAEDTPGFVDLVEGELRAVLFGLAAVGGRAAEDRGDADADWIGGERWDGGGDEQASEQAGDIGTARVMAVPGLGLVWYFMARFGRCGKLMPR